MYMYTFEWTVDTAVELNLHTCMADTCTCRLYLHLRTLLTTCEGGGLVYLCVCLCCVCTCMFVFVYVCACACLRVSRAATCIHVCMLDSTYERGAVPSCVCMYVCVCLYVCVCVHVCA